MNHNQSKKSKQGKGTPKTNKNFIAWNPQNRKNLQSRVNGGPKNFKTSNGQMTRVFVAQSKQTKTNRPMMVTLRNGDCHVVHREYLQDITAQGSSPSLFSVQSIPINPGQASTFPWLSKVAQNFESYRFKKLKFCYETEAPSSLGGTLVLALDYDASDPVPATKQQMLAYRGSVRSAPWTECCHSSIGEDLHKQKSYFVRPGSQPVNTDVKMYDVANLFVATQGVTTGSAVCGELYVEYDVELMTPIYENNTVASNGTAQGTAGTAASAISAGLVIQGTLVSSVVGNVFSLQNLIIGAEYIASYGATADAGPQAYSALIGVTLKSSLITSTTPSGVTCIATATSGSITVTNTGAVTNPLFVFSQIPLGTL